METYDFRASGHRRGQDNKFSENEEFSSFEDARARAMELAMVWGCEWVNVYDGDSGALLCQLDERGN